MIAWLIGILVFIIIFAKLFRIYMIGASNIHNPDLSLKTIIVTGGTNGIGRECVRKFCELKAKEVIFTGRNQEAANALIQELKANYPVSKVTFKPVDFSDLQEIKNFAQYVLDNFERLDILLNNAGALFSKLGYTKQGFEKTQGVNHIAVQYLTGLLFPLIKKTKDSRVVNVSSMAHDQVGRQALPNYDDFNYKTTPYAKMGGMAYHQSKLYNVYFTKALDMVLAEQGLKNEVQTVTLHPGCVNSGFVRDLPNGFKQVAQFVALHMTKTTKEGAQTSLHCCLMPQEEVVPGAYYDDCKVKKTFPLASDFKEIKKLWNFTNQEIVRTMGSDGYSFSDLE